MSEANQTSEWLAALKVVAIIVGAILGSICFVAGGALLLKNTPAPVVAAETRAMTPAPAQATAPVPATPAPEPTRYLYPADQRLAVRLAHLEVAQRDAALCAIEANADSTVSFGLLARSPARFEGQLWAFNGRAIQVEDVSGEDGSFALVSLDSYASEIVAVFTYTHPSDSVVAERRVRTYGRIVGTFNYTTRNGEQREVPKVIAVSLLAKSEAPRCARRR